MMGYYRRNYGYSRSADRFCNYAEISARFDSTGTCGHDIRKGDAIGWHRGLKKTRCADCWRRWCAENAEADLMEGAY